METFTIQLPLPSIPPVLSTGGAFLTAICILCVILATTTTSVVAAVRKTGVVPGIEIVGPDPRRTGVMQAKAYFVAHAKEMLFDAVKRCKGTFQVMTPTGAKITFPGRYTNELKNIKDLTVTGFIKNDFFPYTPGFEAQRVAINSTIIQDVVRTKLTQSLGPVSKDLCEEADTTIDELFSQEPNKWHLYSYRTQILDFVACLSTRVFMGKEMRRNPEWIRIAVEYTIDVMGAARALRMWPRALVPLVHWFVPEAKRLRDENKKASALIDEYRRCRDQKQPRETAEEHTGLTKTGNVLGWMEDLANKRAIAVDLTGGQLGLTMAAIHTTSDLLSKCLYFAAMDKQLTTDLRAEVIDVLQSGGEWKKTALYNMKLLDSFMKEVQRVAPPAIVSLHRYAEATVTLSDGTIIPKGSNIQVVADKMYDPSTYPAPESFDARRYLKMRSRPGEENHWQFVTTSEDHLGFGHGMHACPGRFFASNEVKIALVFLLLRFDWRVDETLGERRPFFMYGTELIVDPALKMEYKRRMPEINIMSFV